MVVTPPGDAGIPVDESVLANWALSCSKFRSGFPDVLLYAPQVEDVSGGDDA
jgi:hypothetical protein